MEQKAFIELVERLEVYAREHPSGYRFRVGMLAALGYLYLFSVVTGLLLIIVGALVYVSFNFLFLKFLWIPLSLAAVVLRSLWIKMPEPDGHELTPTESPQLFEMIEGVRLTVSGPSVNKVLLTGEFNAGIVQIPMFGVFGPRTNYLVIGLPILKAMTTEEVRAVVAHEFGHLSGDHGKFAAWIYHVRQTWVRILTTMQQEKKRGSELFEVFFDWYAPYFGAYSFVLARAREYEADRCSVEVVGKANAARALVKLEIKDRALNEDFWPSLLSQADQTPEPPSHPFSAMLNALRQPVAREKAHVWFTQSLESRHGYDDTHPSLADRLEAMGYPKGSTYGEVELLEQIDAGEIAGDRFLETLPVEFVNSHNRLLKERFAKPWRERHKFVLEAKKGLEALGEKEHAEELSLDERWERARFVLGTTGFAEARPHIEEVLTSQPKHAGANYAMGEGLLDLGDIAGVEYIEVAMTTDLRLVQDGCQLLFVFWNSKGRLEEAETYKQRLNTFRLNIDRAKQERKSIHASDKFIAHELSDEAVEKVREQLAELAPVKSAFLVRKALQHFPEEQRFVLAVLGKYPFYQLRHGSADGALVRLVASCVKMPGNTVVIALEKKYKPLRDVFRKVDGAEIYRAEKSRG